MNMKLPNVHNDWRKETNKGNNDNSLPWKTEDDHHQPPPPPPDSLDKNPVMKRRVFSPQTINYEQIQLDSGNKAH